MKPLPCLCSKFSHFSYLKFWLQTLFYLLNNTTVKNDERKNHARKQKEFFFLVNSCLENSRLYGGSQVSRQKK